MSKKQQPYHCDNFPKWFALSIAGVIALAVIIGILTEVFK